MQPLLDIRDLKTYFFTKKGLVKAIDGISLVLEKGETLALVGESGCGKSITALSILRLVPAPGRVTAGQIFFAGEDLLLLPATEMRRIRGNRVAMIFQEPMTALNPVLRIGDQITEVLELHKGITRKEATRQAASLLEKVGIPDPERRLRSYPHQLSGGLRQRVVIAMALACNPQLLIADEPTTALDVTIQAQIMELLRQLRAERDMTTLLITHDLGIVAESADRVAIMYAGLIVEYATVRSLFKNPLHPYTVGLLASVPRLDARNERLQPVRGHVPSPFERPSGCPFRSRCPETDDQCAKACPELREVAAGHQVRCWRRA